jgi:5-methylcytosine-specific restriction endonuclease McrA
MEPQVKLCECGCGKSVLFDKRTGKPNHFLAGHAGTKVNVAKSTGAKRPQMKANKNPSWAGGADKYWQRQAKIIDNYTCRVCGLRDPEIMEVDHIIPKSIAPELRHELNNLVTLCPNDHRRKTNREKTAILRAKKEG